MTKNEGRAQKIVGTNSALGRVRGDFYPTPPWATEALIAREKFSGGVWEPACGQGHISKVFTAHGHEVHSTDILDHGFGKPDVNFLISNALFAENHQRFPNIVTNPPFNVALEFLQMAKQWADVKIAFLLKTIFLEGVERYDMWQDKEFPLKKMYQFSRRVSFGKEEGKLKGSGMIAFSWFVWEKGYTGEPTIEWIK